MNSLARRQSGEVLMHELSVCIALLDKVQSLAEEHGAGKVTEIVLKIGPLSGIEVPLLQHAYPLAAAGSLAEDANLLIETANVIVRCSQCGAESEVVANRLLCPACEDFRTTVISGDELVLERIELETRNDRRDNATTTEQRRHIRT